jgi:DNA-binding LacI/PurR family transcriptional regulator
VSAVADTRQRTSTQPTLSSVATELGVSRTTVSNAFSRPDQLSPALREQILSAARRLGYPGPHPSARALARGTTGVIAVVFPEELTYTFTDPGAMAAMRGVATACMEAKAGLLFLPITPESDEGEHLVRTTACDGLILYSLSDDHPLVDVAISRRLPTVTIDQPRLDQAVLVGTDNASTAATQIDHLVGLGHRRLALIGYRFGPDAREGFQTASRLKNSTYLMNRWNHKGFSRTLRRHGIAWTDVVVYEAYANAPERGAAAAEAILATHPDITAFAVDSDTLACGVVTAITASGRRVPADVSVIGVDDNADALRSDPPLTTIATPSVDKGLHAGRIATAIEPADPGSQILLPTRLVIRKTTAPAPD